MSKESTKNHGHNNYRVEGDGDALYRGSSEAKTTSDFVLQWGNRKRLRCMKIQVKSDSAAVHKTPVRVDRRVTSNNASSSNQNRFIASANGNVYLNLRQTPSSQPTAPPPSTALKGNGYFNLRQRPASPSPAPRPPQRVLRNSEAMRGLSNGGVAKGGGSEDQHRAHDRKNKGPGSGPSSGESAHDSKSKGGGGGGSSSGGSAAAATAAFPPKFVISLTNKEKEEDFMAIKGSKLPQRPKKRAKFIQRTLNILEYIYRPKYGEARLDENIFKLFLVSPGAWLCDLTLDRYEVREKKISKKRPRGLKAMNNVDSDSE